MDELTEDYLLTIGATRSLGCGVRFGPLSMNVATQNGVLYVQDRESAVNVGMVSEFSRERFMALVKALRIEPEREPVVKVGRAAAGSALDGVQYSNWPKLK